MKLKTKLIYILFSGLVIFSSCEKNNSIEPNPPVAVADSVAILGSWLQIYSISPWVPDTIFGPLGDSLFYTFTTDSLYRHGTITATTVYPYRFDDYIITGVDTFTGLYINDVYNSHSITNDTLIISKMYVDGNEDTFIKL
jgi:hypothetical protein